MNQRETELKTIVNEFATWEVKISNLNSLNLYDANLFSENSICEILNCVFDYQLKNINSIFNNFPAIDLGDKVNRISIQVTSTKSSKKIQHTLDTFFEFNLDKDYDELFVFILGKKQKKYSQFVLSREFNFSGEKNIIDFQDLLKIINFLPTDRIKKISKLLQQENSNTNKTKKSISNASRIKRNLALKKKMKRDFLMEIEREHWERSRYEPWIRFKYSNVLIRSIDDTSFPDGEEPKDGEISSWFKGEFWDFYESGIELVSSGRYAIFDKKGNWDVLDYDDKVEDYENRFKVVSFFAFLRIPYDYIVEYDMEPDPYNGIPSIYVEYAKNGMPYEEILYGILGNHERKVTTYYFENDNRKKLK